MVLLLHPKANVRCSCVPYIDLPMQPAAAKGQPPMTLHCNCTGAIQKGRQQKIRDLLVKKKIPELFFFFLSKYMCFWDAHSSAPPLSIWRRTSEFRRRFITAVDCEG